MARIQRTPNPPGTASPASSKADSAKTGAEASRRRENRTNGRPDQPHRNRALEPDRKEMGAFIRSMFKHATSGNYASLRSFRDDRRAAYKVSGVKLNGDLDVLIDKAMKDAGFAANDPGNIVFCPPIATFNNGRRAREVDLAEGLVLSVECDAHAKAAIEKLTALLGPPTVVVASGGQSMDPGTGELEPKLHGHYRLRTPARTQDELARLKRARELAARLVGSDPTSKTIVHPLRWPRSWHRKSAPRLCRIVSMTDTEIDLDEALKALEASEDNFTKYGDGTREPLDVEQKLSRCNSMGLKATASTIRRCG
jgi:hypothetical protein